MNVPGSCRVWCWRGIAAPDVSDDVLSRFERERATHFRQPADAVRSVTAAALLRLAVADWLGAGPAERVDAARELRVDRSCARCGAQHGPPRVAGGPHLSVTHTGAGDESVVIVAATTLGEVGVDAEKVTDLDFGELASTVLATEELAAGAPRNQREWFTVWTRKEAILKATGDGLRRPMPEVLLGAGPSLVSYGGRRLRCALQDIDLGSDTTGALAVLGVGDLTARVMDARQLLDG